MSTNPYDVRITVTDYGDPNTLVVDVEARGDSRVAADWLAFFLAGPVFEAMAGHTYTCRTYDYGSGVAIDEATTAV